MSENEPTEAVGGDPPEIADDDIVEIEDDREDLDAAMRELFAVEVRRVASESFRRTRLRDQARERALRERAAELRLRIAAETDARLQLAHERDVEHDVLRARIDELVTCLAVEETKRGHAEKRARTMEDAARVAESMLARSNASTFDRGLRQLRQTLRWGTAAIALVALLVVFAVLQDESVAGALFHRTSALPVPSESRAEVEAVTGAARPWIASAPAEKPSMAPVAGALDVRPGPKPRLARARVRAVVAPPPSPGRSQPTTSVDHDDDPLGGLDDL